MFFLNHKFDNSKANDPEELNKVLELIFQSKQWWYWYLTAKTQKYEKTLKALKQRNK